MECTCAQTRPRLILASERIQGNGVRPYDNSKGKIPSTGRSEEDRTHDAASRTTASPTHYRLSYSGPIYITIYMLELCTFYPAKDRQACVVYLLPSQGQARLCCVPSTQPRTGTLVLCTFYPAKDRQACDVYPLASQGQAGL